MWTYPHHPSPTWSSPYDLATVSATNHLKSTTCLDPPSFGASVCGYYVDFSTRNPLQNSLKQPQSVCLDPLVDIG